MATRGFEKVTASDAAKLGRRIEKAVGRARRSKYGNVKTDVGGILFDSKREADRYAVLVGRLKNGGIRKLRRQHAFTLDVVKPNGEIVQIGTYRSDFDYEEPVPFGGWVWLVEDAKGMRTDIYKWKKRHVEAQYGIQIHEV